MSFLMGSEVDVLGWTLLHFVWQGALVALLLWCGLALMGGASARARYGVCCLALVFMVALPLATFARLGGFESGGAGVRVAGPWVVNIDAAGGGAAHEPLLQRLGEALAALAPLLPWVWLAGVVMCAGRLGVGLVAARRLRTAGTSAVERRIATVFAKVAQRVGVRRAVGLLESVRVEAPTVVGWLKPVVLLPACCLAAMSAEQMEALLAHELAHIRRHDYLVSVLQSVVEALLFYHPAVWWVSRQVRRERECCCDKVAAECCGDVLEYARALSWLEEQRLIGPAVGLGANGGVLHMRIRRVLGYRDGSAASQMGAVAVLCVVVASAAALLVREARAQASQAGVKPAVGILVAEAVAERVPESAGLAGQTAGPIMKARFAARSGSAGQTAAGVVDGVIVDPTGAVMPRVTVSVANVQTGERQTQHTDETGRYAFSIPPGRYTLDAAATGFQMAVAQNLQVTSADPLHLTLKLKVGAANEYLKVSSSGAPGAVSAAQAAGPMRVSAGLMAGNVVSQVPPVYPPDAKVKGIQGTVVLKAVISKSGDVEQLAVVSGPTELQVSALDAVKQWKYKPYLLNGQPVQVETTINVNYTFSDPSALPPSVPGESRQAGKPVRVSAGVMAGQAIVQVPPVYPADAKAAGVQGTVVLHAVVSRDGEIEDLQVVSGPGELAGSAVDAVRQWKYKPYLLNGEPVEVETTVNVNYTLAE